MSLFQNLTIGRRFVIVALGGLILLIGTIILFHLSVERVFQDQFLAAGSSILDDKKMYIEKMFQSWADDLLLASKNPAYERYLTDTEDKISFWEQEQKKSFTYIRRLYQTDEICYIRKDGRELSRLTYDDFAGADDLSVDESAAPFFSPTLGLNQDEVFQSRPYVSGDTGRWVIATATPIISEIGEKLALLHFEIPVSWFQGMIKLSESGQIAGKKSAEGTVSDIFIINDKKEFVAHTSLAISEQKSFPGALSGNKEDAEYDAIIEKMAEGDTGGGKFSQTARELYILYAPLKLPENNINKWSIGVVLDIKKTTALALPWINSFLIVAVSGILLLAMVFGISANTARVLRQSIEQIISASSLLRASTKQISSEAQKNTSVAQQAAAGAMQQSRQAEEISKSVSQMASAIQQMSSATQEVSSTAVRTAHLIQTTGEEGEHSQKSLEQIKGTVQNTTGMIKAMSDRSQQIKDIVDTITNLSEQTNLLALNAAIEAARAGDAGRGFAVVADEVRKLAESSGKSAEEVKGKIKEILQQIKDTVSAAESGVGQADESSLVIGDTLSNLQNIAASVQQVSTKIQEISAGIEQQSALVRQIAKTMESVAVVAEQNASGAQQLSASVEQQNLANQQAAGAAETLHALAADLEKLTGQRRG